MRTTLRKSFPQLGSQPNNLSQDTFHKSIAPYVLLGQLFGIFPICGIFDNDPLRVSFKWFSFRVIVNLLVLVSGILNAVTEFLRLQEVGVSAKSINGVIFFVDCCIINVLFLHMATQWKGVAAMWDQVDRIFMQESYRVSTRWTMRYRMQLAVAVLLLLAFTEHLLSIVNLVYNLNGEIIDCGWGKNVTDFFRQYSLSKYNNIYTIFPYHAVSAVFLMYTSTALTIFWNYLDIFIITLSIGIASRFEQINMHLRAMTDGGLLPNEQFWIRLRSHYVSVCELLEAIDRAISWLVLVSCATNLYFICLQILNVSQKLRYLLNDIYYWFSLLFLIGRTAAMFLCAARIHETAKKPHDIILKIPDVGWCVELDRFATQLQTETVALSGMGFFNITRQLLFSMAGTIVTYELVMLKFDKESEGKGYVRPCTFLDSKK
ncbi:gustatory receptor for sugar taste 64a [Wyeomyia smithii]|uniref:gustatory receptor for sugar taste 64a n=1 Tax=Wyeomyia smithii TaxID=174621 RepID=UPI002467FA30|nr:gustatory receptor for sugar taste 64a [Wyeomyia smithii]XP_055545714.1 gustatory receptor for sugar taste 64a [Wyeomyia smithii]XP_055545715.1 gustatory receptor for sugar taste 64a [Wyeomyia smithii]